MDSINFFSSEFFWYHSFMVFLMGTLVGSFLNVCIYRIPAKKSIVFPNSYCYSCGSPIRWYDNIPLLSYIILRGRCRDCAARISPRYFFIELLTGIIFFLSFWRLGYTWATPIYIVFICYFIIATFTDFDHWIIPDSISIGGFFLALLVALVVPSFYKGLIITRAGPFSGFYFASFLNALVGGAVGFGLLYIIGVIGSWVFQKEAMGGGDIKLFALVGALLGWKNTLLVIALSSFIGATVGLILILVEHIAFKNKRRTLQVDDSEPSTRTQPNADELSHLNEILAKLDKAHKGVSLSRAIPFGPYIAIASIIVILWHTEITNALNYLFFVRYY
ncbi:prepilin peptidase [Candidatus Sumerlaeota bacterium]|nr:prepilin peptidase [Candidatus Sumerlaeota bacterium]